MRIATWNIPHSFRASSHSDAWRYLLNELSADYYLAQEVIPPDWVFDEYHVEWQDIGDSRTWGSAVVSGEHDLRRVNIDSPLEGGFVVAESDYTADLSVTLISLYGLFESIGGRDHATPNLHRMLSDLTGILGGRDPEQLHNNIVLGGDLNVSLQYDHMYGSNNSRLVFDRLENFGLKNTFKQFYEDYQRTLRHPASNRPLQNDYLFVSDPLADRVVSCEVLENDEIREFSDHNPVVIELE